MHRVKWRNTNRTIHFLSDLEFHNYLDVNWEAPSDDQRENFPLERTLTLQIADRLGVRHPRYPGTKTPTVMTTDLVLTYYDEFSERHTAISVKPTTELENERVLEKLKIEKIYWETLGHKWLLRTSDELTGTRYLNLGWLQHFTSTTIVSPSLILRAFAASPHLPARANCSQIDTLMQLERGQTMTDLKSYLARKVIAVDINNQIIPDIRSGDFSEAT